MRKFTLTKTVSTHSRPKAAGSSSLFAKASSDCFNTQPPEGGWHCCNSKNRADIRFQHTAARRRLGSGEAAAHQFGMFQHTAARRRLAGHCCYPHPHNLFQHTAARRRLGLKTRMFAGCRSFNTQPPEGGWFGLFNFARALMSFNTQPPEGGWLRSKIAMIWAISFNTQPPEGGWEVVRPYAVAFLVSTHSRPKAAGLPKTVVNDVQTVSTHSRPKAAGPDAAELSAFGFVSTHSRPKAAGFFISV